MAITPRYLKEVADAAEDLVTANNKYILDRIAKRMRALFSAEGDVRFIPSSIHDLAKLESAGLLQDEIEKELKKRLPEMEKELNKAFKDATKELAKQTQQFTESIVEAEKAMGKMKNVKVPKMPNVEGYNFNPKDLNLTMQEVERIEAAFKRTKNEIKNLTATMPKEGYNSYIDACDAAYWKVRSGVSPDTAISEALDELTKKGVTCIEYNSGRKDRIEVAVGRAVRTGINQMTADVTLTRCAEMGVSHVLVSQHLGARVTKKEDFTNHSHWQGKVYYLDWDNELLNKYRVAADEDTEDNMNTVLSDIKEQLRSNKGSYPDFIEECGYKKMLGICGINCRHTFSPFFDGINKNTYKQFDEDKNEERFKQEQKQRAMERDIMQDKLRLEEQKALKEVAPSEEVINKIRDLQNQIYDKMDEYNEFCKANKLPNHTNRMRIHKIDPKTVQATDKVIDKKTEEIVKKVEKNAKFEPKKLQKPINLSEKIHAEMTIQEKITAIEKIIESDIIVVTEPYIADNKITGYLLKEGAKHFDEFKEVGYVGHEEQLKKDIINSFDLKKVKIEKNKNNIKITYFSELGITKKKNFLIVWQIDEESNVLRFITAYRNDKERR